MPAVPVSALGPAARTNSYSHCELSGSPRDGGAAADEGYRLGYRRGGDLRLR